MAATQNRKLVILGGGFGGVWAAMAAANQRAKQKNDDIEITLISNRADLCIKPRLYEKPDTSMLVPLKPLFDEIDVKFIIDEVVALRSDKVVECVNSKVAYDKLIFALGSQVMPSELNGGNKNTFNIDSYQASKKLEQHLSELLARQSIEINISVVGSGFTGIELITKLHQRFQKKVSLTLIERSNNVAASLGESMQPLILAALQHANVKVLHNHEIISINNNTIVFAHGKKLSSDAIVLTTGPKANILTSAISTKLDSEGRVYVDANLQATDQHDIFVAGDCAKAKVDHEHYSLMSCQHAMPMGISAGVNAVNALLELPLNEYHQAFYATCLDLGESGALFSQGWQRDIVKSGRAGAAMKEQINNQWIYPPMPSIGKAKIFNFVQAQINQ